MTTANVCSQLIHYKQWADDGLYRVIEGNLERLDALDKEVLLQILDHMHAVDRIFQHHLLGQPHEFERARLPQPLMFDALAKQVRAVDEWYVDYAGGLGDGLIDEEIDFVFTSGAPARMRRGDMMLHVPLHGTYHRGNAGLLLQKNGVKPNDDRLTDFLGAEL